MKSRWQKAKDGTVANQLDLFGSSKNPKTKTEAKRSKTRQRKLKRPFDRYQIGDRLIINRSGSRVLAVIRWIRKSKLPGFEDTVNIGTIHGDDRFVMIIVYEDGHTLTDGLTVEEAPQRKKSV